MIARFLYTLVLIALLPWALLHLLWRSRLQGGYRRHWGERFGIYRTRPAGLIIWIHAVSVGETRAAETLVTALAKRWPDHRVLMTHMTPTGRQTGTELYGDRIDRVYLPYDYPFSVARFLDHWRPEFGLIMETELWPNLIAACHSHNIPVLLVNARMSGKSAGRYAMFPALTRSALHGLCGIAAQADADAKRLRALGAQDVEVLGNLKFDLEPPAAQLLLGEKFRKATGDRPVFLCASTREGEEALILDAWKRAAPPAGALLVIVPRHPQRCDQVTALIRSAGFRVQRRSEGLPEIDTEVWLGDSLGELFAYYAACDVAFIGGSLLKFGCQNLIEACAVGKPVLIGPSTYNFARAADDAISAGACAQMSDASQLAEQACALLRDEAKRQQMGSAGLAFALCHRGATARTMAWIEKKVQRRFEASVGPAQSDQA